MDIKIIIVYKDKRIEKNVAKGTCVWQALRECKEEEQLEGTFYLCEINGKYESLNQEIVRPCQITLLDYTTQAAHLVYQNSMMVVLFYAAKNILKDKGIYVMNTLSGGVYCEIEGCEEISPELVIELTEEMKTTIEKNLPIETYSVWGKEGRKILENEEIEYVDDYLKIATEEFPLRFCNLNGHKEVVYSELVPFTGMIDKFSITPYKKGLVVRGPEDNDNLDMSPFEAEDNIYKAFEEETKWAEMLKINCVEDINSYTQKGEIKEKILLAEAFHQQKLVNITEEILGKGKRIVFISGPSSSGKTTTAKRIILQLKVNGHNPMYIGTDDYFLERYQQPKDKNGEYDFDKGLENMDVDLFARNMKDLLDGKEVDIPVYDFLKGEKVFGTRISKIDKDELIVIEGIHALNKELLKEISEDIKYKIYISPLTQMNIDKHNRVSTRDSRLLRRIIRDNAHRNYKAEDTIESWPKVKQGEERNVFPGNKEADVVFNSSLIYEYGVLKKYVEPLLLDVEPENKNYAEARRLIDFIRKVDAIEDETAISNVSLLREFIGGSVF